MDFTTKEFDQHTHTFDRAGCDITFETGKLAPQADGSVIVSFGENKLLCTAVLERNPDADKPFTPLMIDFRESFASAGKIGGSRFRRREGRPATDTVLYARMTDRAIRPLLPKGMTNDLVVSITPLSLDREYDLGAMSIIGSSLAIMSAGIPLNGPIGAVRIGRVEQQRIINPTRTQLEQSQLDLIVAGPQGLTNMIEAGATEIPDQDIQEAFTLGQQHIDQSIEQQHEFLNQLNIEDKTAEIVINKPTQHLIEEVKKVITPTKLEEMMGNTKTSFNDLFYTYQQEAVEYFTGSIQDDEETEFTENRVKDAVFTIVKNEIRRRTIEENKRLDDRDMDQVRPLFCEVGTMPRTHGSGLFRRGDTQVLTTATLGGPGDYEINDTMEVDEERRRYIHHYNFPPFSVNEARGTRGAGRRELGHGALAEKALIPVMPVKEDFPYVVRTVSECLASGGSTSQASVCGSTLALMDAGVPISAPVSGVAMGLMSESDEKGMITKYKVLTDLAGTEDFTGDMDFKVAGTKKGITAIQLDTKVAGLPPKIVAETIIQAHTGRNYILDFMLQTIDQPRAQLSKYAPKIYSFKINPDKVREVIGKGGEMIDKIIEKANGVTIDFEDDGLVTITDRSQANIDKAIELIKQITEDLPLHTPFTGKIARVENYGVFVDLPGGKSGLVHVSKLGVRDVAKSFNAGDAITVKITEVDSQGRLNLAKV